MSEQKKNNHKMEECCVICPDQVMIPVHYTCFGCDCHQLTVSCRTCAHNFLGLNKKSSGRKFSQKCLYCEKTCSPRSLTIENAYSVNKMMMKMDTSKYECTEACGFKGDQLAKDLITLGVLYELTYQTQKGFDKFRLTDYFHELGEETGCQPVAVYDRLNDFILISGGSYRVEEPGIID